MPSAPPRVCARCGQPAPRGRPCACRPAWEHSTHPGTADKRMATTMATYRQAHPRCEHPGCPRLTDTVDHIVPIAEGGSRYDPTNYQSLCRDHHRLKTTADALRGKRRPR